MSQVALRLTSVVVCLTLLSVATGTRAATLIAFWPLEETDLAQGVVDSAGTLPPGAFPAAGVDPDVPGPPGFGSAVHFDGSGAIGAPNSINVGGSNVLNLANNFSVTAWVNFENLDGKHSIIGSTAWSFRSTGSRPHLTTFGIKDYFGDAGALTQGEWIHMAMTLDSNNTASFFVNGQPAGQDFHGAPGNTNVADFHLGIARNQGSALETMFGSIDDVRVYEGVLTVDEIQLIMNPIPEPSTVVLLVLGALAVIPAARRRRTRS